jgi:hypothetical protein
MSRVYADASDGGRRGKVVGMPKAKKPSKAPAAADPDKLERQAAGTYRTADGRFEVRDGGTGWFLVDGEQTNDFGQELIQGPYPTLVAARAAIPPARSTKITPIRPSPPTATSGGGKKSAKATRKPKPPPPPSWIDRLQRDEAAAVRRLVAALERDGMTDAEDLVRRDREGIGPAVATRLIERRLEAIVADLPERGRPGARELIRRAAEVLSAEGTATGRDMPGWTLVEIGPDPEPPNRRITIRDLPG